MKKDNVNNSLGIIDISEDEMISINGGAYNLWDAIGYIFGVNFAIHQQHAESAPWVAFGSK